MLRKLISGISWIGLLRLSTRIIGLGKILILARLLTPFHFGLYGIASLVLSVIDMLSESGVTVFLIQKEGKLKDYINSAWFISIARGLIISFIIFVIAPLAAYFFRSVEAENLLKLISLVPLIKGFINPAIIKYLQDLDFKKDSLFRFVVFFVDAVSSIIFGLVYQSAICLIVGLIVGALTEVFLSYYLVKQKPSFKIDYKKVSYMLSRGKWVTVYGISEYVNRNIDDIFIGKFFGVATLGIYQMAYKIAILPITEIADVFGKVTFPIYVKLAGKNKDALKSMLLWNTITIVTLLFPISVIFFLYSDYIIINLLGEQWLASAEIIRIIIFFAIIRSSINPILTYFLALKKQEYMAIVTGTSAIILLVILYPFALIYGVKGVALSVLVSSILSIPIAIYLYTKLRIKI